MEASINGDVDVPAVVDSSAMEWAPSPSPSVWRKRLHRVGPAEAGQVTSVVRYGASSSFPAHDHPDGEEILVLDGVFSDEHGDWPAGTFLLNPEGFRHAPFSRDGCVLFVKLRQFPGRDRQHVAVDTANLDWSRGGVPGLDVKALYRQPGFPESIDLEHWAPGTDLGEVVHPGGVEIFVVDGAFEDHAGAHPAGSWLRLPTGARQRPRSASGCVLHVRRGGHELLWSDPPREPRRQPGQ